MKGSKAEFVNSNEVTEVRFVEMLMKWARDEQEAAMRVSKEAHHVPPHPGLMIVKGDRGVGKTFFENYLLTKYSDIFDRGRIIWVRCNMVAEFDDDSDLVHRIVAQTAKVVMRYYEQGSDDHRDRQYPIEIPASSIMDNYISSLPSPEHRVQLHNAFETMKLVFHHRKFDRDVDSKLVPRPLGEYLFNYLQEQGFAFIVVLDGVDRLEATTMQTHRFRRILQSVARASKSLVSLRVALVAVTRTSSVRAFPDYFGPNGPYLNRAPFELQVGVVPMTRILERRFDHIVTYMNRSRYARKTNWKHHMDSFRKYLETEHNPHSGLPYIHIMEAQGDNRRAQVQIVQLAYLTFLAQSRNKAYLLTESLMKAGRRYPPLRFRYSRPEPSSPWDRHGAGWRFGDNVLLPSLFQYPYLSLGEVNPEKDAPRPDYLLLGLRVCQLVAGHERRRRLSQSPIDDLSARQLIELLFVLFQYPRSLSRLTLEEYDEVQIIHLDSGGGPISRNINLHRVQMMPKLEFLLTRMLSDAAYLNLAAMRVPIAKSAATDNPPYIRAVSFDLADGLETNQDTEDQRTVNLAEWVATKITNVVALLRLLKTINDAQRPEAFARMRGLEDWLRQTVEYSIMSTREAPGMFDLLPGVYASLERQIGAIELSLIPSQTLHESVLKACEAYQRRWQNI